MTFGGVASSSRGKWCSVTAAVAVAIFAAGCSSSGSSVKPSAVATSQAATAVATPAPSPSPAATSAPPVSPFESDPAVVAMRAWAVQAAKTVNSGVDDDAALDALMTPDFAKNMTQVLGGDVGLYYPGPLPFFPLKITSATATDHQFQACVLGAGFAQNKATHQPAAAKQVLPAEIGARLTNGTWLIYKQDTGSFSCDGVAVPEPTW